MRGSQTERNLAEMTHQTLLGSTSSFWVNKQCYFQILDACQNIPKQDKLLLRKCLMNDKNNLKQGIRRILTQIKEQQLLVKKGKLNKKNNEVLLNKYCMMLKKQAQKYRKNEALHLLTGKRQYKGNQKQNKVLFKQQKKQKKHTENQSSRKRFLQCILSSKKNKLQTKKHKSQKSFVSINRDRRKIKPLKNCSKKLASSYHQTMQDLHPTFLIDSMSFQQHEKTKKHQYKRSRSLDQLVHNYTQRENLSYQNLDTVFTDPFLLQDCRNFLQSFRQKNIAHQKVYKPKAALEIQQIFKSRNTQLFSKSLSSSKQYVSPVIQSFLSQIQGSNRLKIEDLKNLQIKAEQIFNYVLITYPTILKYPRDFSMSYQQVIDKVFRFLQIRLNQNSSQLKKLRSELQTIPCSPFITIYDCVTLSAFGQFLEKYFEKQVNNNRVDYVYNKVLQQLQDNHFYQSISDKGIREQEFQQAYQNKNKKIIQSFKQLKKRAAPWQNSISYWQMYWLKDTFQFQLFSSNFI